MRANSQARRSGSKSARKPPRTQPKVKNRAAVAAPVGKVQATKRHSLGKLLSPQNLQESLKTVGNLRTMVKNWLTYLQQADQLLDTVFVTSNSLKQSGVLEKIIKQRGKNMTTEDFTNILIALMNSPMGNQFLKNMSSKEEETATPAKAGEA